MNLQSTQRFPACSPVKKVLSNGKKHYQHITLHRVSKSDKVVRLFYICYDITSNGLESTWADLIRFDWVYNIEQNYALTQYAELTMRSRQSSIERRLKAFGDSLLTSPKDPPFIIHVKSE